MATAAPGAPTGSSLGHRLWHRSLERYPSNTVRYTSLGIVVLATVLLYYQLYLAGGVATSILRDLHMSFLYYVNVSVIGYAMGAVAALAAGLADRWGRANIVVYGLGICALLCTFALPNVHSSLAFAIVYIAIGFVEGIILVATPALVRDFSPQLGRASAMGFWTLGPVLGSLVVSISVSSASATSSWQHQYTIAGIVGLVVFAIAVLGLKELSPGLRDQLMVSHRDRALIEARALGLDADAVTEHGWSRVLKPEILASAFAISVFLIIYYLAVGFFPIFFQTVYGYSQSHANSLGNYFWAFDAAALLGVGFLSDRVRVRKPFMLVGGIAAVIFTILFAVAAHDPTTSYGTFRLLIILIAVALATGFAPWMASFTETVERRSPALIAHGLSVWGMMIRIVIAVSIFFVPHVVNTVTPLVEQGPLVKAVLTDPTPVGRTTVGKVASAAAANPTVIAKLQAIKAEDGALIVALQQNPVIATTLAKAQAAGVKPTTAQLATVETAIGPAAFSELIKPDTPANLAYLQTTAPAKLGAANFAALSAPTAPLSTALATLTRLGPGVARAAAKSPDQWRTYWIVSIVGEVLFIPLIFLLAGHWSPTKARRAEEEHAAKVAAEMQAAGLS